MTTAQVGGYSNKVTIEGISKNRSVTTLRFSTADSMDAVFIGEGATSVLLFLKQIAQQIIEMTPDNPLPPEWEEIVKVPQNGTKVTVSFGIRSEFTEDI